MDKRTYTAPNTDYKYGFNGKEQDLETFEGAIAFESRIFDSRIGRFFSLDPRTREYPWQTPYAYYKNSPISVLDIKGEGGVYDAEVMEGKSLEENIAQSSSGSNNIVPSSGNNSNSSSQNSDKQNDMSVNDTDPVKESFANAYSTNVVGSLTTRVVENKESFFQRDLEDYLDTKLVGDKGVYTGRTAMVSAVASQYVDQEGLNEWMDSPYGSYTDTYKRVVSNNPAIPGSGETAVMDFLIFKTQDAVYEEQGKGENKVKVKVQDEEFIIITFQITVIPIL